MLVLVILAAVARAALAFNTTDPASLQLSLFKQSTMCPIGILSLSSGSPVEQKYATSTINSNLLRNEYFIDSINHLLSERAPERINHVKGAGAFGYFEVTHDVTDLCKSKFLDTIGKKTRVANRFSPVALARGGNDLAPSVRGFSIKFYTEDGNFDIAGFNIPVFVFTDPVLFPSFIHAFSPNPVTNLNDPNLAWDFSSSNVNSILGSLMGLSRLGVPKSYGHLSGYSIHTLQLTSKNNETHFARFHFKPDSGESSFSTEEALKIGARDPDYLVRDLYNTIGRGDYLSWTVYMQPLTLEEVQCAFKRGVNVFDVARDLSTKEYPLRQIGKLVLNENPKNYFADVEQLAICPGNIVPGILGAPDKMFEARSMAYRTAQAYRLGINFNKLPVNRPLGKIFTYNRDGAPTIDGNEGGAPNYYPNFFNGPEPIPDRLPGLIQITEFSVPNTDQFIDFYRSLPEDEKNSMAANIAATFNGLTDVVQDKVFKLFKLVGEDLVERIQEAVHNLALGISN